MILKSLLGNNATSIHNNYLNMILDHFTDKIQFYKLQSILGDVKDNHLEPGNSATARTIKWQTVVS